MNAGYLSGAILAIISLAGSAWAGRCDPQPPPKPIGDALLTLSGFAEAAGVTEKFTAPVKHADPDAGLGCPGDDPDLQKAYVSVLTDPSWPPASRWRMWYSGWDGADYYPMYAESADGLAWTRPQLGQVGISNAWTFTGSAGAGGQVTQVAYEDGEYIAVQGTENAGGWTTAHKIWVSPGPVGPWTLAADLDPEYPHRASAGVGHGMGIVKTSAGWVTYAQCWRCDSSGAGIRSIAAYSAPGLAGPWEYHGVVIPGWTVDDQRHGITVQRLGDAYFGIVESYDDSPLRAGPLYWVVSDDGITWRDDQVILVDYGLAVDSSMIFKGAIAGAYFYHVGCATNVLPCEANILVSSTDAERIVGYSATSAGHLLTHPIEAPQNAELYINADAAGGVLRVAIVHPFTGSVLAGYGPGDFDALTADSANYPATWAGQGIVHGMQIQLRFELENATLYGFKAE